MKIGPLHEVSRQHVRCDRLVVVRVGRDSELTRREPLKAQLAHQTSDTPTPDLDALVDEFTLNARTPVRSTTDLERIDDLRSQALVFEFAI